MLFEADPKTKALAHYVISHSEPTRLGATKLNKVMWRADVAHYRLYGTTISGQESYIRMPQGPVPNHVADSINELKNEGKIIERLVDTPVGTRREFIWREKASAHDFTPEQIEIIQESIRTICDLSAVQASDGTHDVLWDEIANGLQLPIRAASVSPGHLDPSDIEWALSSIK